MKTVGPHVSTALINVASFDHPDDALGLSQLIQAEGIDSVVKDERTLQRRWFLTHSSTAGIHVCVPEPSLASAESVLKLNPLAERFLRQAPHCPSCRSTRIHFPQMTRKNVLPTLVAHVLVLLGVMRQEYYCEACHYTWLPGGKAPSTSG